MLGGNAPIDRRVFAMSITLLALMFVNAVWGDALPLYKVTRTINLGAPDRWDYVVFDPASHRVFVAHGDRLTVVDGWDGSLLGEVTDLPGGPHGIAISTDTGKGYTDEGRVGEATAFDLISLKIVKKIKAEEGADAVLLDPQTGHIFVVDGDSGNLTVIDPQSDVAIKTITTGDQLEYAAADGRGNFYVNGVDKNEIVRINTGSNRVESRWQLPNCVRPTGLALDTSSRRLFSSCRNGVLDVLDADSGKTIATLRIGKGTDAVAFDPKRRLIFSSNGEDGSLSIIHEKDAQSFVPLPTIATAVSARTMSIDPQTGRLYLLAGTLNADDPHVSQQPATAGAQISGPSRVRRSIVPGSLRLMFLDPTP
jgi:DNA-binding beta-propeller fold protein YncE